MSSNIFAVYSHDGTKHPAKYPTGQGNIEITKGLVGISIKAGDHDDFFVEIGFSDKSAKKLRDWLISHYKEEDAKRK